ncbi:MAG: hypothetical protein JNL83_00445 [Myxococcales bacterium]|nr:hypothetical protein [Myxococcales bacterium]
MSRSLTVLGLLVAAAGVAAADDGISVTAFDPENATAPSNGVEGDGVKVGEGTVIHPIFGVATGVVSNVFYEDRATNAAGILRLLAEVGAGSLSTSRLTPTNAAGGSEAVDQGDFQYRASLRLSYDLMLSGNDTVNEVGGLGVGATIRGLVNPMGTWSFGFDENFTRLIRAANFETDADTNRDINTLALNLIYHPTTRSIGGYLYYNNTLDIFERSDLEFADRLQHRFGIHPQWRLLPQTVVFADVSLGAYGGLGDSMKVSSYPLVAQAGFATLFTPKTSFNLHAGYTNGFYASGPSYSSVTAGAQLGYRYSPLGRAALTYDLRYEDSVNANYYRDHVVRLWLQQDFVPFSLLVQPEVHFRTYEGITIVGGPPTRDDVIFSVIAGVHYNFRNSLAVGIDYHFTAVQTDYEYMTDGAVDDPSFVRHQLLAGLRWAL